MVKKPSYKELEQKVRQLEKSQNQLKALLNNIPDLIWLKDTDGHYLSCNHAFEQFFGSSEAEIVNNTDYDFVEKEVADFFRIHDKKAIEAGQKSINEEQLTFATNGYTGIFETIKTPMYESDGSLSGVLGVARDISERKKSEELLKINEQRYKSAQRLGKVGNWEYDLATDKFWGSNEAKRIYGLDPESTQFTTATVESCIPERKRVHQALIDLIEKKTPYDLTFEIEPLNGKVKKIIRSIAELIYDENNDPIKVTGVVLDITSSKKAEEKLKSSERRFRQLIEKSPLPMVITDHNQDPLFVNSKFSEYFGYTLSDISTAEKWWQAVYPDPDYRKLVQDSWMQAISEAITRQKDIEMQEWIVTTKDGNRKSCEFYMMPMGDIGLVVMNDITERKQLEAKLQHAQKLESLGNLSGGIAHEFNNILSIIIGNNELILDDLPEGSLEKDSAEEIRTAGLRARDVVRQLLTFSRQDEVTREVADLRKIISESLKLLRTTIPKNIEIKTYISDTILPISCDATQINQVLINLCKNAADAIEQKNGNISVTLQNILKSDSSEAGLVPDHEGPYVQLKISDNGVGMSEETVTRIFDPYFTTKDIGKGTGIGLAVVHGIIKAHGGTITVESKQNTGTTFSILFPALTNLVSNKKTKNKALPGGTEQILFVDDEPTICTINKKRLEKIGYSVITATEPKRALAVFSADPSSFDLVITDMAMPTMTGEQLIDAIKTIRPHIPTIICTGYSENISKKEAENKGIDAFMIKPIDRQILCETIREVLDTA